MAILRLTQRPASSTTPSPSPTTDSTTDSESDSPTTATSTNKVQDVTTTNLNTGGIQPTATGNSTQSSNSTHTDFPAQDPAGNVVMVTPAATAQSTNLYKIGDTITWGWNYTNLQGTPTAIDILASVAATATFTLTQNMTFATPGVYEWDTGAYDDEHVGQQLLTEQYTLAIYDADGGPSATAEPGYLAPYSGFKFGLYQPKGATPLSDWHCATCSAALGAVERRAVGAAVGMSVVTVLSFTWFVVGFGALA